MLVVVFCWSWEDPGVDVSEVFQCAMISGVYDRLSLVASSVEGFGYEGCWVGDVWKAGVVHKLERSKTRRSPVSPQHLIMHLNNKQ